MLSILHATYEELLGQGALGEKVDGLPCPRPLCCGILTVSEATCERGVLWLRGMDFVYERIRIVLAICLGGRKPHVVRVLPADILPRKVYSLPAMEEVIRAYLQGGRGLRTTLAGFSGEVPHFTTLYGWVQGMGRYARERAPEPPSGPSFAEVRQELERRFLPALARIWDEPVLVDPLRYRPGNEVRLADLKGAVRLLRTAGVAFPESRCPLTDLVLSRLLATDLVAPFCFPARIRGPPSNTGAGSRGG